MSATLKAFRRFVVESGDSNLLDWGSVVEPMQDTAVEGLPISRPKKISIAAGASVKIWDAPTDGPFAFFFIESAGYLWLSTKVDAPVSGSNLAAAGTAVNYPKTAISCIGPHIIDSVLAPVVTSAATYAGSAFGSAVAGRKYELWLKNPGTEAVEVTYGWTL